MSRATGTPSRRVAVVGAILVSLAAASVATAAPATSSTTTASAATAATRAAAVPPSVSAIDQPLQAVTDATPVEVSAAGDGQVAWVVRPAIAGADPRAEAPAELWTLRDGVPAAVTRLADVASDGITALEVGTAADGAPVAVVASQRPDARADLRLVRLDTGQVRTVSTTRSGQTIGGVGLDHGRYLYTLHAATPGARNTSGLWRATLTGTSIGRATKLRTSRRGETWGAVLADRNRVAVATARRIVRHGETGTRTDLAFGTPRGSWSRTGVVEVLSGAYRPAYPLGFTRDRRALLTLQQAEGGASLTVTRAAVGGGESVAARLRGFERVGLVGAFAYDATRQRLLGVGPDAAGAAVLGFTAPVAAAS